MCLSCIIYYSTSPSCQPKALLFPPTCLVVWHPGPVRDVFFSFYCKYVTIIHSFSKKAGDCRLHKTSLKEECHSNDGWNHPLNVRNIIFLLASLVIRTVEFHGVVSTARVTCIHLTPSYALVPSLRFSLHTDTPAGAHTLQYIPICIALPVLKEWCLYHGEIGRANGMRTEKVWQCSHEREAFQTQGRHERLSLPLLLLSLSRASFCSLSISPPPSLPHPSFRSHNCTFRLKLWMLTRLLATLN